MTISRSQTQDTYDRLSRWYDLFAGPSERACRNLGLRLLAAEAGERILELGAGTGQALAALGRATAPRGTVTGLDLSPGMCRVAVRRLLREARPRGSANVVCGDAVHLPFEAGCFDAAFMSFTLELFSAPDMAAVLVECARVLRLGGRLGVVGLSDRGRPGRMQRAYVWAHDRFPAWVDCRPIPVTTILAAGGFQVRDVTCTGMWGLPVDAVVAINTAVAINAAATPSTRWPFAPGPG